jgi:alkanesulfonate monooxygenase SsuD/methylene tetrahydromethanopterin reductase-like flavin-dependent oxidoreductase (luciferase family)
MRLGYFTMPLHPLDKPWHITLKEDRAAIVLADELGFYDAFVGEHLADKMENVTNSMMFLASLIPVTKQIKLASGTSNISQMHPVLIASHAAMMDNMLEGRFIFGISPGALMTDAEALGNLDKDRFKMFEDAINVILEIWTREPPYDIDLPGNQFPVSTRKTGALELGIGYLGKPFQKPYPEIVGTVVAPFSKGVIKMGERDFHPLSANFLLRKWVATHWPNYVEGKKNVGKEANPLDWRIARTIFVADDDATAKAYGRDASNSPYREYYQQMRAKMFRANRHGVFKQHMEQPDSEITLDYVLDECVIYGTVNKVVEEILKLRTEVGPFGEVVYAGMDWVDEKLARRSMELMATQVMPRVNAALGESA